MKTAPGLSCSWDELEPYLDRVFELAPDECAAWLSQLAQSQPLIAQDVRTLLSRRDQVDATGFLEHPPFDPDPGQPRLGAKVGAYTLEKLIGRGGMGEVWLAARSDGRYEGRCAIKFLDASLVSPRLAERFRREGQALARLTHPNIARLLDAGTTEQDRAFLALEYVDGVRIDRYCESLPVNERVRLIADVVAAVAHAHGNLVIHRDLKPSNVLVTGDGRVKLLDFGVAKLMSAELDTLDADHTRLEDAAFTPEYASPEQLLGDAPSTATDIYQLGLLLFVLLSGRNPLHTEGGRAERIRAALERSMQSVSEVAPQPLRRILRGDLDAILAMALRRDAKDRYATAQALQDDLLRYLAREPVVARRGAGWYRARKFIERHRIAVAAASLAALGLCATLGYALLQGHEAAVQRDAARRELARATAAHDFTVFMLSAAAPGDGRFSTGELLAQNERLIDKQFAADPPMRAEMLATVGTQYMASQHWGEATRLLSRARDIAASTGDPTLQARTECPLALMKMLNGLRRDAETMIEAALANLPQRPEHAQLRAECMTRYSEFGFFTGEAAPMIQRATLALRLLDSVSTASAPRRIDAMSALAYGHYLARDNQRAEQVFEQLALMLEESGMERTLAAADIYNNWSLLHFRSDIRRAEVLIRRTVELRRSIEGKTQVGPVAIFNHAGVLLVLGRLSEAAPLYDEAIRTADERKDWPTFFDASMELAELHIEAGDLARAEARLATLSTYDGNPRFDGMRRALLAYYRAHLVEAQERDPATAQARYGEAVQSFDAVDEKTFASVYALCGLSRTALINGDVATATDAAARALDLAQQFAQADAPSHLVGMAQLASGDVQMARGDRRSGARAFESALRNLDGTLGPDHRLTKLVREKSGA